MPAFEHDGFTPVRDRGDHPLCRRGVRRAGAAAGRCQAARDDERRSSGCSTPMPTAPMVWDVYVERVDQDRRTARSRDEALIAAGLRKVEDLPRRAGEAQGARRLAARRPADARRSARRADVRLFREGAAKAALLHRSREFGRRRCSANGGSASRRCIARVKPMCDGGFAQIRFRGQLCPDCAAALTEMHRHEREPASPPVQQCHSASRQCHLMRAVKFERTGQCRLRRQAHASWRSVACPHTAAVMRPRCTVVWTRPTAFSDDARASLDAIVLSIREEELRASPSCRSTLQSPDRTRRAASPALPSNDGRRKHPADDMGNDMSWNGRCGQRRRLVSRHGDTARVRPAPLIRLRRSACSKARRGETRIHADAR